ncbi:MAG TPA: hypothetical protein VGJ18_01395 [Gemmatimonadaceae bacterium]
MSDRPICPSSRCVAGATLVGVVMPGGRVAYAADRIEIDEEFVRLAHEGRSPERRFRFASPCVRGACSQWTGTRCGVIDSVLQVLPMSDAGFEAELPRCSIRPQCRWFLQTGAAACAVCPLVITDLTDEQSDRSSTADA